MGALGHRPGIQPQAAAHPGVKALNVSGPVLADIYMRKITMWNDPAIKAINKGVNLPATKIVPVYPLRLPPVTPTRSPTSSTTRARIGARTAADVRRR